MKSVFQLMHTQSQSEFIKGKKPVGKESKVAERQRERERVCVRVLVKTDGSVDQHPQTAWDRETHLAFY